MAKYKKSTKGKQQTLEPLWPLNDPKELVQLIATVSKSSIHHVTSRLLVEFARPGSTVSQQLKAQSIPPYRMTAALQDFYKHSDAFVYETSVAHYGTAKYHQQAFILEQLATRFSSPCKVVCFGDGLGFDSARLAHHGHEVYYHEPCIVSNQFAQVVFSRNHVDVTMLNCLDEIEPHSLDCIVCLDVLEHCPEPWKMVERFSKWLQPNGVLLSHAPFWMIMPELPTHLEENRKYTANIRTIYPGMKALDAAFGWCPLVLQTTNGRHRQTVSMWLRLRFSQFVLWLSTLPLIHVLFIWYIRYVIMPHDPDTIARFQACYDSVHDTDGEETESEESESSTWDNNCRPTPTPSYPRIRARKC